MKLLATIFTWLYSMYNLCTEETLGNIYFQLLIQNPRFNCQWFIFCGILRVRHQTSWTWDEKKNKDFVWNALFESQCLTINYDSRYSLSPFAININTTPDDC